MCSFLSRNFGERERKITINIKRNGQWNSSLKWICLPFYNEAKVDDTSLPALLCKSCNCYANWYFLLISIISMIKRKGFVRSTSASHSHSLCSKQRCHLYKLQYFKTAIKVINQGRGFVRVFINPPFRSHCHHFNSGAENHHRPTPLRIFGIFRSLILLQPPKQKNNALSLL